MAPPTALYVITSVIRDDDYEKEGPREPEVYTTKSAANVAARNLMNRYADFLNPLGDRDEYDFRHNLDDEGLYRGTLEGGPQGHIAVEMCVYEVHLNQPGTRVNSKRLMPGEGNWPECGVGDGDENDAADGDDDDDDDNDDGDVEMDLPNPKRSATTNSKSAITNIRTAIKPTTTRKKIPSGIPDCLKGVKILFTGTFETMDRVTSIATANKYGAEVVTKLEDTDYIVIGQRAGPKKLQIINELELETISEGQFFEILENGVTKEKRQRMANRRKADEEEAPEERRKPQNPSAKGGKKRARR